MMAKANKQRDEWRIATRENNFIWLESFGCKISRSKHAIRVEHDELSEYSAWLVYGDDAVLVDKLRRHVENRSEWSGGRIFIDVQARAPTIWCLLRDGRFDSVGTSATYAAIVEARSPNSACDVRPAMPDEVEHWSSLYVDGFSRQQYSAQELRRWRRCFLGSSPVRSWFLLRLGKEIGVVQTCHAQEVVGLYSFALTKKNRNFANLHGVRVSLASHLTREGDAAVYFELESRKPKPPEQIYRGGATFKVVRVMSTNVWKSEM